MAYAPAASSAFLAALSPPDLRAVEPQLRDVSLKLGAILCAPGDPIDFVYFPTSGMISIVTNMAGGHQVETGIVGRTGMVGSAVGTARSFDQCMVQIAGEGRRLPRDHFLATYENSKSFRGAVNGHNMSMWALAQQCAACNAVHPLQGRLARWLLDTRDLVQTDKLPLTQEFIAMMLGVQRTSVTLAERQLQDAGLIQIRRGRVILVDVEGLRERACDCHEAIKAHRANLSVAVN